jgi:hypothetical protein
VYAYPGSYESKKPSASLGGEVFAPNEIGTAVAFTISSPKLWPGLRWCSAYSVWAAFK